MGALRDTSEKIFSDLRYYIIWKNITYNTHHDTVHHTNVISHFILHKWNVQMSLGTSGMYVHRDSSVCFNPYITTQLSSTCTNLRALLYKLRRVV